MANNKLNIAQRTINDSFTVTLGEDVAEKNCIMAIRDADGEAYKATDTSGYRVIGINMDTGDEDDTDVVVANGVFLLINSSANALTDAHIGENCYVEGSSSYRTVASTGTASLIAGTVVNVATEGVYVDIGKDNATTVSAS